MRQLPANAIKTGLMPNEYIKGVAGIVIQDGCMIFERRGGKQSAKGFLDFCSGKTENDERPYDTMVNELQEELGVDAQTAENVTELGTRRITLDNEAVKNFFSTTFYIQLPKDYKLRMQQSEVSELIKMPLKDAFKVIREGKQLRYPYDASMEKVLTTLVNHLYMDEVLTKEQVDSLILPREARPREQENPV